MYFFSIIIKKTIKIKSILLKVITHFLFNDVGLLALDSSSSSKTTEFYFFETAV